jgi:putative intracellular protease/amidase
VASGFSAKRNSRLQVSVLPLGFWNFNRDWRHTLLSTAETQMHFPSERSSTMASVVMVVSGANVWTMKNAKPHPTGFWSEELVTPHRNFSEAGLKVTVASPGGVGPTVDPLSFNLSYNNNDASKVREQQDYMKRVGSALTSPMRVEEINPDQFDVIFLVGGHCPMQDMAVHPTIGTVLVAMLDNSRKIVAAVCHGPAALLTAARSDGTWALKDRQLTGFSNEEETQAGFAGNAPLAFGRSPPHFRRALYRKGSVDATCRRRRQSRHLWLANCYFAHNS